MNSTNYNAMLCYSVITLQKRKSCKARWEKNDARVLSRRAHLLSVGLALSQGCGSTFQLPSLQYFQAYIAAPRTHKYNVGSDVFRAFEIYLFEHLRSVSIFPHRPRTCMLGFAEQGLSDQQNNIFASQGIPSE